MGEGAEDQACQGEFSKSLIEGSMDGQREGPGTGGTNGAARMAWLGCSYLLSPPPLACAGPSWNNFLWPSQLKEAGQVAQAWGVGVPGQLGQA